MGTTGISNLDHMELWEYAEVLQLIDLLTLVLNISGRYISIINHYRDMLMTNNCEQSESLPIIHHNDVQQHYIGIYIGHYQPIDYYRHLLTTKIYS